MIGDLGRVVLTREPSAHAAGNGTLVTVIALDRSWNEISTPFVGVPFAVWRDRIGLFLDTLSADTTVVYRLRRDPAYPLREVTREEWLAP